MSISVMRLLKFNVIGHKTPVFGMMTDNFTKTQIETLNDERSSCLSVLFAFVYYFLFQLFSLNSLLFSALETGWLQQTFQ